MSLISYPFPQPDYGPYLLAPPVNNTGLDSAVPASQFPQNDYVFQGTNVCLFNLNPAIQPVCSPAVSAPQPQYVLVTYPLVMMTPTTPSVPEPSYLALFAVMAGSAVACRFRKLLKTGLRV